MIQDFKKDYDHFIPFVRFYFRCIIKVGTSMFIGEISKNSLVLDFGCGKQFLKKYLKSFDFKIIGYDAVKEFSDIGNYTIVSPEVIFCNHVLEHLDVIELRRVLDDFKRMKPKFIITGVPTENFISKICAAIGRSYDYSEHKTRIGIVHDELNKRFNLLERKTVMTLTVCSKWIL